MFKIRWFLIIFATTILIYSCASTKNAWLTAQQIDTIESYENFIKKYPNSEYASIAENEIKKKNDPVFIVLNSKGYKGSLSSKDEKKLLSIGGKALDRLILGLDEVPQQDKGKIVLAISEVWGKNATKAIPKIIEHFPTKPIKAETGINISKQESQEDKEILLKKYGKGRIVAQSYSWGGSLTHYFYVIKAPAAVAALYEITRECPGITKTSWTTWLKQK